MAPSKDGRAAASGWSAPKCFVLTSSVASNRALPSSVQTDLKQTKFPSNKPCVFTCSV